MRIKKSGRTIFGAELTNAERKALDIEISRQLADYTDRYELEIESMILLVLMEEFGFGEKRLRRVHNELTKGIDDLVNRYQMDDQDAIWLCTQKLKERGIDISTWNEEDL